MAVQLQQKWFYSIGPGLKARFKSNEPQRSRKVFERISILLEHFGDGFALICLVTMCLDETVLRYVKSVRFRLGTCDTSDDFESRFLGTF